MKDDPTIEKLPTGWFHIRWSAEKWAQVPPHFSGLTIPDEYIFHPAWNRQSINEWWRREHCEVKK